MSKTAASRQTLSRLHKPTDLPLDAWQRELRRQFGSASGRDRTDKHRLGPTYRLLADHQVHDENGKVTGYRHLDRIGQTLSPMLLRPTKKQVLSELRLLRLLPPALSASDPHPATRRR